MILPVVRSASIVVREIHTVALVAGTAIQCIYPHISVCLLHITVNADPRDKSLPIYRCQWRATAEVWGLWAGIQRILIVSETRILGDVISKFTVSESPYSFFNALRTQTCFSILIPRFLYGVSNLIKLLVGRGKEIIPQNTYTATYVFV